MEAAPVELAGRDHTDPACDLVRDRNGENRVTAGDRSRFRQRERGRHRRAAHVNDRLVVRVVELERLRKRGVRKRRLVTPTLSPLPRMRQGPEAERRHSARANRAAEPRLGARQRQAEHIEDAHLRRLDDVGGKIFESNVGNPLGELTGERHDHSPGAKRRSDNASAAARTRNPLIASRPA